MSTTDLKIPGAWIYPSSGPRCWLPTPDAHRLPPLRDLIAAHDPAHDPTTRKSDFLLNLLNSQPSRPIRATRFPDEIEEGGHEDLLIEDASRLEADGMPGDSLEARIAASIDLLERLLVNGSTRARGPFRHHVRRLLEFLGDVMLDEEKRDHLAELVVRAES